MCDTIRTKGIKLFKLRFFLYLTKKIEVTIWNIHHVSQASDAKLMKSVSEVKDPVLYILKSN